MKSKIYIFITALFIGVVFGYAWRMFQVEPQITEKIQNVRTTQREIVRGITELEVRLGMIEGKGKRGVRK